MRAHTTQAGVPQPADPWVLELRAAEATPVLMVVVFAAIGLAVGLGWWFSPTERAKRKLRGRVATPIRALRPGEVVKITGTVQVHEGVRAPFSDELCGYWFAEVSERSGKSWRTVATRWESSGFWVDDGEERVWVEPGDERLALPLSSVGASGTFDDPTQQEAEGLTRVGVPSTGFFGTNRTLRFEEARLDHGELVSVIGEVRLIERDGDPVLTIVPSAKDGLVISDAPGVHG
ncbi:MAG: hypothetical protein ABMA64_22145 [Myxococcota bacterium]